VSGHSLQLLSKVLSGNTSRITPYWIAGHDLDGTQQDHTLLDVGAYDPGVQSLLVRSLGPFPSFRRLSDGH